MVAWVLRNGQSAQGLVRVNFISTDCSFHVKLRIVFWLIHCVVVCVVIRSIQSTCKGLCPWVKGELGTVAPPLDLWTFPKAQNLASPCGWSHPLPWHCERSLSSWGSALPSVPGMSPVLFPPPPEKSGRNESVGELETGLQKKPRLCPVDGDPWPIPSLLCRDKIADDLGFT